MSDSPRTGMSVATARTIEYVIVGISVLALLMVFQPFSLPLYSVGAGLVVFAGLAFNLVPLCTPGRSIGRLLYYALIILMIFAIVTGLALGSAELYSIYLT